MTQPGILKVLLTASLLSVSLPESRATDCSNQAAVNRLSKCVRLDINKLMGMKNFESMMTNLCDSVECSITCYENALKDCTSEGIFRVIDFKVNRVSMRYACNFPQALLNAVKECGDYLVSWTCFDNFLTGMMNATEALISSPSDTDSYVTDYCSASKDYIKCAAASPLGANGSCTASQATMLNNIYSISLSSEACGISQNNTLFATYGGPPEDTTTCGARITMPFYVVLVVAMLFLIILS